MTLRRWLEAPRRLPLLFLAVTLIPVLALGWLTSQLLEKDSQLEAQRAQERVEHAADRIVAASHQRLSDLESQLAQFATSGTDVPPAHTVLAIAEGDRVTVAPAGALVYYPILPKTGQPPRHVFYEGERYEYQQGNPIKAIDWFRALARTDDDAVRAGALLRLGRNQRKAERIDAALTTYGQLQGLGATTVEGFPAALLALEARCLILEKAGRKKELSTAAAALRGGLTTGAWPISRDVYDFYMVEARRWTGNAGETDAERNARATAAAFQSTYERWVTDGANPQRQWLVAEGRPVLLASTASQGRLVALVAGADFLQEAWREVQGAQILLTDGVGDAIFGRPAENPALQAVRTTDASRLPWTLKVTSASLEADPSEATTRRLLQLAGLAMVVLLFGGSAYFTLRGVARELAVARLQSDFVSAVSHEFRTPLASVRHLSDMLSKGRVSDDGQRQQCYDFLSRESERLEHLVEELLDFGRIEAGAYRYRFERVDAAALLRALVSEFQEKVGPRGYRIEFAVEVDSALVLADREALSRAIGNLLDNAVKYSPGSDTISVALGLESGSAVIRVKDRGIGIALGEQKDIFRKFVRGSNARSEQIKGTGIGLAMVRHIIEAHHGEVRVESQPDQGSTFALLIPIEKAA
jgi:signal transduction histidine kinase